jgi:hypothetical protein
MTPTPTPDLISWPRTSNHRWTPSARPTSSSVDVEPPLCSRSATNFSAWGLTVASVKSNTDVRVGTNVAGSRPSSR